MQAIPSDVEFGALHRTATAYGDGTFPRWENRWKLMPRNLWQPVSMNHHVKMIYGQLDGMCSSNGACETLMIDRAFRGKPQFLLSPEHLYSQHSRWGTGSTLDENLKALVDVGVCTRKQVPAKWPVKLPSDWKALAAKNRMLEYIDLDADFDAVATALQRYHVCLIGVNWPGGGGHAIACTELAREGRGWVLRGPNSWGPDWGEDGFYTLTERQCADFGAFGCWAAGSST
jgi:hypothetical protein